MIGLYKGTSAISRIIKFRTWSEYSHAAWINEDFSVIEAWQGAGVVERPSVNIGHTPGTEIDLFDIDLTPRELADLMFFLQSQIGKPYDYNGVFGFLTRDASMQSRSAWFCFELIFAAFVYAQKPLLLRVPAHKVDGGMLSYSPLLRHIGGIRTQESGVRNQDSVNSVHSVKNLSSLNPAPCFLTPAPEVLHA